jgi:hypothetical protein
VDNNSLTIPSLASDAHNAGEDWGRGSGDCHCCLPQALATAPPLPLPPEMVPRTSSASSALPPPPLTTVPPMSVAQFARMLLSSKTDVPGSTLQAISAAGTPAAQIKGPTVPWPSSALLWPPAIAVAVVLVAGVCGQCHHPCKPVQAGGVVDQVDPACAPQVRQGAPGDGATTAAAAVGWQGG